ncbi:jg10603 [Pararge aegeria aegeria]|uniref:Jg10603 protein n=1 Tax=Pararge aegeria aegeria TaxID=348720 RepID=A0A8S4S0D0_9NEOP|nr:jg10603 [Pararge aegeria aegeria]
MSLPKIKEQSRLLDLSSDEESDLQLEIIPNRKRKITRKERNRHAAPKIAEPNIGQEVQYLNVVGDRGQNSSADCNKPLI